MDFLFYNGILVGSIKNYIYTIILCKIGIIGIRFLCIRFVYKIVHHNKFYFFNNHLLGTTYSCTFLLLLDEYIFNKLFTPSNSFYHTNSIKKKPPKEVALLYSRNRVYLAIKRGHCNGCIKLKLNDNSL